MCTIMLRYNAKNFVKNYSSACSIKFFTAVRNRYRSKLEGLSLSATSIRVLYLRVRLE
jgi:hypothetical protein